MYFNEKQKEVDEWISQFKIKYFSPQDIIVQLSEEIGELADEIIKNDETKIGDELTDVLFALICMANSHEIKLQENYKFKDEKDAYLNLTSKIGKLAKEINHEYGPKKKKKTENESSIKQRLEESFSAISLFAEKYEIDINSTFTKHMNKLYGRDNSRWEKNETCK